MNSDRIDIDRFLNLLPPKEAEICTALREIVLSGFPELNEKLSYNVPYYFLKRRVCFIWPASVKPGPPNGVQFGICNGYQIRVHKHLLEFAERKIVGIITFNSVTEIVREQIEGLLAEAIQIEKINEEIKRGR